MMLPDLGVWSPSVIGIIKTRMVKKANAMTFLPLMSFPPYGPPVRMGQLILYSPVYKKSQGSIESFIDTSIIVTTSILSCCD